MARFVSTVCLFAVSLPVATSLSLTTSANSANVPKANAEELTAEVKQLRSQLWSVGKNLKAFDRKLSHMKDHEKHEHAESDFKCPSMFVAVLSAQVNDKRRDAIRDMWAHMGDGYGNQIKAKFGICTNGSAPEELLQEAKQHDDVMLLDCEEGYLNGILTRKVATAMTAYINHYHQYDMFMKIDDDTWMSSSRLCDFMKQNEQEGIQISQAYMGVFAEGTESMTSKHPPIRDTSSAWFEPYTKFAKPYYPTSAKGGPGYILPRDFVKEIIQNGIAKDNELNNEDKAVGVWVTKLKEIKQVQYINIPGTDGYDEHTAWIPTTGSFQEYPFIVHHHLEGQTIACMQRLEESGNPDSTINHCFTEALYQSNDSPLDGAAKHSWEATGEVRIHMPY